LAAERGVTVEWVQADVTTWAPPAGAFDLVIVFYLHLPAALRRAAHRAAAAALGPGGTLLVVGHDLANLAEGYGGPQDPDVLLTAARVSDDLAGLDIDKAGPVTRIVTTGEGARTAVDTLVRAVRPPQPPGASP
jgi:hypothetical protein